MTAYELADDLEKLYWLEGDGSVCPFQAQATMLRQQADRIAELEKQSEPVAWMEYIQDEEWEVWYTEPTDLPEGHSYKPLYLAPQTNNKNRSWSDICDEATAVWDSLDTSNQSNIECARAWFLEGYHQALTRGQE